MKSKILHSFFFCIAIFFNAIIFAQGGVLTLNSTVTGKLENTTPIVYTLTTPADGLLRLKFTTVGTADLYVTLFDSDGTTAIATAESFNNSTVIVNADGLASGNYSIKITPFSTSYGSYALADSLFTSGIANDIEPNGTATTALALSQNGSHSGHVGFYNNNLRDTSDWYKVTTNADGLLRVYLTTYSGSIYSTTSTNPLDVNMTLYQNDGTTLLGAVEVFNGYAPSTNFITKDGLAPGTYYIKVQPYSTNQFANYKIYDSLFTTPIPNDAEPNDSMAKAIILPQNGSLTGHVGYLSNNQRDSADWYKITTTADGLLRVYLTTSAGSKYSTTSSNPLDVNLTLYDNDGTTQLGVVEVFNGYAGATNFITKDGLASGTYYVKVQNYSTTEFANYKIADTLFTATLTKDTEPNSNRATALILPLNKSLTGHVGYYYNNQRDTVDWYKVTTTADGLLRIYLTTDSGSTRSTISTNLLDVDLTLYDNDGTTQLGAVEVFNGYVGATNFITKDGLQPGTYYIKVQNFTTTGFANYKLTDSLFGSKINADPEPNGTIATAISFALNTSVKGHVGYYYNNQSDTADFYKFTTTSTGSLNLYLSSYRGTVYSNNPLDMVLIVYNSDGITERAGVEVFKGYNPAKDSLVFSTLPAGTYYIKVINFSSSGFADYLLINSSVSECALPATSLNFNGFLVGNTAKLSWSTSNELNNKGFIVQKSTDGLNFGNLDFVQAKGNSVVENTYYYTDNKVLSGNNFYRITQIDFNNNSIYSTPIKLEAKIFNWAIFGNPVSSKTFIQLQLDKTTKVAIQIISLDGKIIDTIDKGTIGTGTYNIPLSLSNTMPGMYIIKLLADGQSFSKKIFK